MVDALIVEYEKVLGLWGQSAPADHRAELIAAAPRLALIGPLSDSQDHLRRVVAGLRADSAARDAELAASADAAAREIVAERAETNRLRAEVAQLRADVAQLRAEGVQLRAAAEQERESLRSDARARDVALAEASRARDSSQAESAAARAELTALHATRTLRLRRGVLASPVGPVLAAAARLTRRHSAAK